MDKTFTLSAAVERLKKVQRTAGMPKKPATASVPAKAPFVLPATALTQPGVPVFRSVRGDARYA